MNVSVFAEISRLVTTFMNSLVGGYVKGRNCNPTPIYSRSLERKNVQAFCLLLLVRPIHYIEAVITIPGHIVQCL